MGLIQTPEQLRFSYLAIIEGSKIILNKSNIENNVNNFEQNNCNIDLTNYLTSQIDNRRKIINNDLVTLSNNVENICNGELRLNTATGRTKAITTTTTTISSSINKGDIMTNDEMENKPSLTEQKQQQIRSFKRSIRDETSKKQDDGSFQEDKSIGFINLFSWGLVAALLGTGFIYMRKKTD